MTTELYLAMYKRAPLIDKVIAFGNSIESMCAADRHAADARSRSNYKEAQYWSREYQAHLARVNGVFEMIKEQIEKEEPPECEDQQQKKSKEPLTS